MPVEPLTITAAAEMIGRGELTPADLLEQCLARVDRYESKVRAWVYLDRDGAREQAQRLTDELKAGKTRGPLHGIPVGIKDIIDVFDMPTGCGSKLWANSYARRDATCVERLRQAGAIILGKTVTTAYASFDPSVTRNPWNLERTPGGSSSGSAAAVACGMCLGALGSQTGGSITRPAAYCGVCSLKPTYRRVSVDGVLPLAPTLDHVGVMANCVRDVAILFQTIAGADRRSPDRLGSGVPDCLHRIDQLLAPESRHPAPRFACFRGFFEERADAEMRKAMSRLRKEAGGPDCRLVSESQRGPQPVRSFALPPSFANIHSHHRCIMAVEAAAYHGERLARHPDDYPPRIAELIREGQGSSALAYKEALQQHTYAFIDVDDMIRGSDLLTPATSGAAPGIETTGDPVMNSPWSFTGLPTASIPIGWTEDGLPLSAQVTGSGESDGWLLAAAAWCERVIQFPRRELPL